MLVSQESNENVEPGKPPYLGSPLQPQFENIVVSAALYHLISSVVLNVVQLVLHEQIIGRHLIAFHQQTLMDKDSQICRLSN